MGALPNPPALLPGTNSAVLLYRDAMEILARERQKCAPERPPATEVRGIGFA